MKLCDWNAPPRILVAMDSFKGSLTSLQAGEAVKEAALRVRPDAEVTVSALADGGEGTVDALCRAVGAETVSCEVTGPRGQKHQACYGILPSGVAVIEMAAAAGLTLLPTAQRDPMETTSYGVGEMIAHALSRGCRRFLIGIGGSATNDGGTGMLSALGYRFSDAGGSPIPLGAKGLLSLTSISDRFALPELKQCVFRVACDVTNPLCGENGCSAVFGPQKGAKPEAVEQMDRALSRYAAITKKLLPDADPNAAGAGAAGGLGFAFRSYLSASLESGIRIVMEETRLEEKIAKADLVITGEGRLDAQTAFGKAPIGVAALAKAHRKPVIAFCGCAENNAEICNEKGIDAYFPILRTVTSLDQALSPETARSNLKACAYQVFRLILS